MSIRMSIINAVHQLQLITARLIFDINLLFVIPMHAANTIRREAREANFPVCIIAAENYNEIVAACG